MKRCPRCGSGVAETRKICHICSAPLDAQASEQNSQAVTLQANDEIVIGVPGLDKPAQAAPPIGSMQPAPGTPRVTLAGDVVDPFAPPVSSAPVNRVSRPEELRSTVKGNALYTPTDAHLLNPALVNPAAREPLPYELRPPKSNTGELIATLVVVALIFLGILFGYSRYRSAASETPSAPAGAAPQVQNGAGR